MGGVVWVACQGFLVREACVSVHPELDFFCLSLPRQLVPSVLASSVCWSFQCLISALPQGGGGGQFFRLTCSVVLWGGRDAANYPTLEYVSHTHIYILYPSTINLYPCQH